MVREPEVRGRISAIPCWELVGNLIAGDTQDIHLWKKKVTKEVSDTHKKLLRTKKVSNLVHKRIHQTMGRRVRKVKIVKRTRFCSAPAVLESFHAGALLFPS